MQLARTRDKLIDCLKTRNLSLVCASVKSLDTTQIVLEQSNSSQFLGQIIWTIYQRRRQQWQTGVSHRRQQWQTVVSHRRQLVAELYKYQNAEPNRHTESRSFCLVRIAWCYVETSYTLAVVTCPRRR